MDTLSDTGPWDAVAAGNAVAAEDLFRAHARSALQHADIRSGMRIADVAWLGSGRKPDPRPAARPIRKVDQ